MTTMIVDDLGRIPMSPYLTATLTRAADYATAQSHREVGLEHLLLALTEDPEATVVMKASNVDLAQLAAEVSEYLGRSDDRLQPNSTQTTAISIDLRRILEAAAAAARQGRRREINGAIVLAAIVGDGTSAAANFLRVQGLTFEEVIRALQRAAPVAPPPPSPAPVPPPSPAPPVAAPPVSAPHVPAPQVSAPAPRPDPQPQPQPAPVAAPPPPAPVPAPAPHYPAPPQTDFTQPASTEEILASARERLQTRTEPREGPSAPAPGSPLPRANYPDLGGPASRQPAPPGPEDDRYAHFGEAVPGTPMDEPFDNVPAPWPAETEDPPSNPSPHSPSDGYAHYDEGGYAPAPVPPQSAPATARRPGGADVPRTGPPTAPERRRASSSGPFVGSWPLIEAGQLIENIPRRMRAALPVVVEARIARADVKALAEGLAGGGAVFRHEVVVTKAMSVRLRAPDGGFTIENRSPETQWIENVLGLGSDDFASWRWTVTPRVRGKRQLQLIVSARTVGADGVTAETALPDQVIEVRVATNYGRTAKRWAGWIAAAVAGGLLAKFGEMGFVIVKLLAAKHLGL